MQQGGAQQEEISSDECKMEGESKPSAESEASREIETEKTQGAIPIDSLRSEDEKIDDVQRDVEIVSDVVASPGVDSTGGARQARQKDVTEDEDDDDDDNIGSVSDEEQNVTSAQNFYKARSGKSPSPNGDTTSTGKARAGPSSDGPKRSSPNGDTSTGRARAGPSTNGPARSSTKQSAPSTNGIAKPSTPPERKSADISHDLGPHSDATANDKPQFMKKNYEREDPFRTFTGGNLSMTDTDELLYEDNSIISDVITERRPPHDHLNGFFEPGTPIEGPKISSQSRFDNLRSKYTAPGHFNAVKHAAKTPSTMYTYTSRVTQKPKNYYAFTDEEDDETGLVQTVEDGELADTASYGTTENHIGPSSASSNMVFSSSHMTPYPPPPHPVTYSTRQSRRNR